MNKKELLERLKEIKKYLAFIQDQVKNMSSKEIKESNYNDSDLTQMLMEFACLTNELAIDMGMDY